MELLSKTKEKVEVFYMKDILLKCIDMKKEIADLENRIQNLKDKEADNSKFVRDSVRGSSNSFPYISRSIIIEGIEEKKESKKTVKYKKILKEKKDKLLDLIIEAEEYLKNIDDSRIRQIIRYKYIDGKNWVQIGHLMNTSADAARMELKRYFKNF